MSGQVSEFYDFVPVSQWTDDEWVRIMKEFPPDTHSIVVAKAVYEWRCQNAEH